MAKDLGKLNISVTADKKSFNDAGKSIGGGGGVSGGGGGGGIGDIIRGVSSGGVSGGAQAGAKLGGMLKLAAGIGVAVVGFALLKGAINKTINTIKSFASTIQNTIKKMADVNAIAAGSAARSQIKELTRNIKSAGVLSRPFAKTSGSWELILDLLRPILDLIKLLVGVLLEMLLPTIRWLVGALRTVAISVIEAILKFTEGGKPEFNWWSLLGMIGPMPMPIHPLPNPFGDLIVTVEDEQFEEYRDAFKKILKELMGLNAKEDEGNINDYMAQVGISLTGGAWKPFAGSP